MKYIKNRDIFLKEVNTGLIKYKNDNIIPLNEVLKNDIAWGDSLLGRLLNSISRKVKVGFNLVRMKSVVESMYSTFDEMIGNSVVSNLSGPLKVKFIRAAMAKVLGELENSASSPNDFIVNKKGKGEEAENIKEVKRILDQAIKMMTDGEISEIIKASKGQITDAEMSELEKDRTDILKALTSFKESLDVIGSNKEEVVSKGEDKSKLDYPKMIENFTSVYNILAYYSDMKSSTIQPKQDIKSKDISSSKPVKNSGVLKTTESNIYEINEQQSNVLLNAIKPLYDYSKQYFAFPKDAEGRKSEFYNLINNQQNSVPIGKIYSLIRKKSGINEGLSELLTKPEAMGEKIFGLYQITKTKEAGDFEGIDDKMKAEIAKFNSTMKEILSSKPKSVANEKEVPISELKVFKYSDFIKEAEEVKSDSTDGSDWKSKVHEAWKSKFLGNFKKLNEFSLDDSQMNDLNTEMEKIESDAKFIKVVGKDPVVEVTRLFNRAFRLHTTRTIPSGRSDGKVSNKTFQEYDYVGGGTGGDPARPGNGPYRNIALFTTWENAVRDVLSESKYRPIFNKGTTIQVGEGDPVKNFGKMLHKYMNAMLDRSDMYNEGEQKKFLNEYFQIKDVSDKDIQVPGTNDIKYNTELSSKIKEESVSFVEVNEIKEFKKGQVIKLDYDDSKGLPKTDFAYVYPSTDGVVYLKIGQNSSFIKTYLPTTVKIKDVVSISQDIYFVKLKVNRIKEGDTLELENRLSIYKYALDKKDIVLTNLKYKIKKIYLLKKESGDDYIIDKPRGFDKRDSGKVSWKDEYNDIVGQTTQKLNLTKKK